MNIYVFAGANGSGKSTLINEFLKHEEYQNIPYICPDSYFRKMFPNPPEDEEEYIECYRKAMNSAEEDRREFINEGISFAFETVLSTPEKINFLLEAKKNRWKIISYYVTTNSYEINIARVAQRVQKGGHNVPSDKVRDRYYRSLKLLPELIKTSDEIQIYDNSIPSSTNNPTYKLIYQHNFESFYFNDAFKDEEWVSKYITPYI